MLKTFSTFKLLFMITYSIILFIFSIITTFLVFKGKKEKILTLYAFVFLLCCLVVVWVCFVKLLLIF